MASYPAIYWTSHVPENPTSSGEECPDSNSADSSVDCPDNRPERNPGSNRENSGADNLPDNSESNSVDSLPDCSESSLPGLGRHKRTRRYSRLPTGPVLSANPAGTSFALALLDTAGAPHILTAD